MSEADEIARRARAEARRQRMRVLWTRHGSGEDAAPVSGAEAVSMVYALTKMAWSLAGRPFPTYDRKNIPFRFVPRDEW